MASFRKVFSRNLKVRLLGTHRTIQYIIVYIVCSRYSIYNMVGGSIASIYDLDDIFTSALRTSINVIVA